MASDLLRENSTRNAKNFPGFAPNRFAQLRDSSSLSARSRSPSTKRKQFEGPSSYANAAKKKAYCASSAEKIFLSHPPCSHYYDKLRKHGNSGNQFGACFLPL